MPAPWVEERFQRNVELGNRATFELRNVFGDVRITGVDGNTVRISAIKRVREPNKEAARAVLQNIVIRITERGGGVEVFTENLTGPTPTLVDYEIAVPVATNVSVRSPFGGTIRVNNIKGEVRAETSGHMQLTSVARVKAAKAIAGNIVINGAEGDELNADTLSGALQLRSVRSRTIEVRTVSGALTASDVDCERCSFSSVSGEIEVSGGLRRAARYLINSNSGNIRLVPEGSVGFDLDAITGGVARSEFPLKQTTPSPSGAGARVLRGSYADGSAILSLSSFTGNILIARPQSGTR